MMNSEPSTPIGNQQRFGIGTRQRQQQQNSTYPYRDDPAAPASVRLESYTAGGYGPLHSHVGNGDPDSDKGITKKSCLKRTWYACQQCFCINICTKPGYTFFESDDPSQNNNAYYQDDFNDLSFSCTMGTSDDNGIWLNRNDPAGTIMSCLVWFLILYSAVTITFLAQTNGIPNHLSYIYSIIASAALASHVKTSLTDPGSVPASAVPTEQQRNSLTKLSMCSQCQTFKPIGSHHCRICNRCICKMDHHCPWMNNCIGAGNLKHFLLFLFYTWVCSVYSLTLLGYNYFFCANDDCTFTLVLTQLVRIMTLLSIGAFLFTSSMLMNVIYGIMTGIGTIDRLKKKATGTMNDSDEESIPLKNVFGIGPLWEWLIPIDPTFQDYDEVMGYATPQRYLREQMRASTEHPSFDPNYYYNNSSSNNTHNHHYPPQQISTGSQIDGGASVLSKDTYSNANYY